MYVGHTPVCGNLYPSYMCNVEVKVIFAAVHKQLQRKPRKEIWGFNWIWWLHRHMIDIMCTSCTVYLIPKCIGESRVLERGEGWADVGHAWLQPPENSPRVELQGCPGNQLLKVPFTLHFTPLSLKHFVTIFILFFLTAKGESCD